MAKLTANELDPDWEDSSSERSIFTTLKEFCKKNIDYKKDRVVGFPGTVPHKISASVLLKYLNMHSNNIGLHSSIENVDAKELGFAGTQEVEREVIAMCASLMDASLETVDGYISPGGTEANIVGCWIGRGSDNSGPFAIICSHLTHYSIAKAANILGIGQSAKEDGSGYHTIGTDENGHTSIEQLDKKLIELLNKGVENIIVIGNAGTTMLGSVDDIPAMNRVIDLAATRFPESNIHFHIDAAFGGFIVPFLDNLPKIGFSNTRVSSITIDAHKMGFTPYGAGIILARKGLFKRVETFAPYFPGNDLSLCGSRAGVTALFCWAVMKSLGKSGYKASSKKLMEMTEYTYEKLNKAGITTFKNDINIVAVKDKFPDSLKEKFITHVQDSFPSSMSDPEISTVTSVWNIVIMPHTKKSLVDELVKDIVALKK